MRRKSALTPSTGPPAGSKSSYEGQLGTSGRIKPYYLNWWHATNWSIPPMWNGRATPNKTFTDATTLATAISGLADGDWLACTSSFTSSKSGDQVLNILNKNMANGARIDFGNPAGTHATFTNTDTASYSGLLVNNCNNLYITGGEFITGVAGAGIHIRGNCNNVWILDSYCHNTGMDGIDLWPNDAYTGVAGTIQNCRVRVQVRDWGNDKSADGHAEKGTGLHACNTADVVDSGGNGGNFNNNVVAIFGTEPGLTAASGQTGGAVIECGLVHSTGTDGTIIGNKFYVFGGGLTMAATTQTAANGFNAWGNIPFNSCTVEYLEHRNSKGRALSTDGVSSAGIVDGGKLTIRHGRAVNTNQAVSPGDAAVASNIAFNTYQGPTLQDIGPTIASTAPRTFGG